MKPGLLLGLLGMQAACCLGIVGSTGGDTAGITSSSISGGGNGTGGSTGTAGGQTSGGGSCGGNGNSCSSLVNGASATNIVDVASVAPSPAGGGVPPDGTYYLTSATAYTGLTGKSGRTSDSQQATLQLSGSGTEIALVIDYDGCVQTFTSSVSLAGTQAMLTTACPTVGTGNVGYNSSATTLTLFLDGNGFDGPSFVPLVEVFALQQP